MTREQAKELLPIIQAFVEGKTIEYCNNGNWVEQENFGFMDNVWNYRIKPKYRPFKDSKECWNEMKKHQPFGWIKDKNDGHYSMVTTVDAAAGEGKKYIDISGDYLCSLDETMSCYTFADGAPFGIREC